MNYQESLQLLEQVCNDLLRSQQHPSIAFAAKSKIEEALVVYSRCIDVANNASKIRDENENLRKRNSELFDELMQTDEELSQLKSTHLAAEHGKAFEEAIPLEVEDVDMGHEWRKATGVQPVDDDVVVDILLKDGTTGTDVAGVWDWGLDMSDFGRIEYWRPSESAQRPEHSND